MIFVRTLFVFLALHLLSTLSFAKPSDQDHLKDHCSSVQGVKMESLDLERFTPKNQRALLCNALKKISKGYGKTAFKDFDADFFIKKTLCMNLIESEAEVSKVKMNANLMRCAAYFEDGHIILGLNNLTTFYLPFRVLESAGQFFVSSTEFYACGATSLQIGDEILSIGGESPKAIQNRLRRFIGGSSEGFRLKRTEFFITQRNFDLPNKGEQRVVFKRKGQVHESIEVWRFDYHSNKTKESKKFHEDKFKVCSVENTISKKGYSPEQSLYKYQRSAEISRDVQGGDLFLSFGRAVHNHQNICALKLKSFYFTTAYLKGEEIDVWSLLDKFFASCSTSGLQVVIDMRNNLGGHILNLAKLVQVFGDKGMMAKAKSLVQLSTQYNGLNEKRLCSWKGVDESEINELHFDRLSVVGCGFINLPLEEKVYTHPTVLLTNEECTSSCDYFALFAKHSDSVVQLGSSTHGAMLTLSGTIKNKSHFYTLTYPDRPIQERVPLKSSQNTKHSYCVRDIGGVCFVTLEKKPILPDYVYKASRLDVVSQPPGQGWRDKIVEVIKMYNDKNK